MKRSEKYFNKFGSSYCWKDSETIRYGKYCTLEGEKDPSIRNGFRFKLAEKQLDKMAKEDNL